MGALLSELNNAAAQSDGDGLRSVGCAQFDHNVLNVYLDRFLTDEQLLGNVTVPIAGGNLLEDLDLAPCEGLVGEMLCQLGGDLRRN